MTHMTMMYMQNKHNYCHGMIKMKQKHTYTHTIKSDLSTFPSFILENFFHVHAHDACCVVFYQQQEENSKKKETICYKNH